MSTSSEHLANVVLTQGEPSGIGPELLLRLAHLGLLRVGDRVVACPDHLRTLAAALGVPWARHGFETLEPFLVRPAGPRVRAVDALALAVDLVLSSRDALVTAPIDKSLAHDSGFAFPGHTEYLAARSNVDDFAMLMVGGSLRVVLATIHRPLRDAILELDEVAIVRAARLLAQALLHAFGVPSPRIGVLGLNPHAGDRGVLGHEETTIVEPAIARLRDEFGDRATFVGPLSPDAAFLPHLCGALDGLVALYHDQGLIAFKLLRFADGVNMTLGLPFTRTSPDHGTAAELVGRGIADPSSMAAAVRLARRLTPVRLPPPSP